MSGQLMKYVGGSVAVVICLAGAASVTAKTHSPRPQRSVSRMATQRFPSGNPTVGTTSLAAIVQRVVGASNGKAVDVFYTHLTRGEANRLTSGDVTDGAAIPVYTVVIQGEFSNPPWVSAPAGAPPLSGNVIMLNVDAASGDILDAGLLNKSTTEVQDLLSRLSGVNSLSSLPLG